VNVVFDAVVNGLILGSAYAIAGVVFGLFYRIVKVFHYAFAAIGTAGAYLAATVAGSNSGSGTGEVIGGILSGMVLAGVLTALCYVGVYRPLSRRGASSGTTFVAALALGLIIEAAQVVVTGPDNKAFNLAGFTQQSNILGMHLSGLHFMALALLVVVSGICWIYMKHTRYGRQTEAIISNIEQAELVGIRSGLVTVVVCFGLGALSVLAFVIQGINSSVSIAGGVPLTLFGVLAMLCGGIASIWGTTIAGLLIGVVGGLAASLIPGQWSSVVVFVIAMAFVLIKPSSSSLKVGTA
jgi:branched-chain amino acid transport system permease protein